jgi:hypothetical protein
MKHASATMYVWKLIRYTILHYKLTRKNKKLTIYTYLNFVAYEKKVGNFDDILVSK